MLEPIYTQIRYAVVSRWRLLSWAATPRAIKLISSKRLKLLKANAYVTVKSLNLDSAVGIVTRAIKLMKIHTKVENFFESTTHPYGEKKFFAFVCRFRRLIVRSRFQLRNLGWTGSEIKGLSFYFNCGTIKTLNPLRLFLIPFPGTPPYSMQWTRAFFMMLVRAGVFLEWWVERRKEF